MTNFLEQKAKYGNRPRYRYDALRIPVSKSRGWAELLPNQVLFFLKANTLKVKPLKLPAGIMA